MNEEIANHVQDKLLQIEKERSVKILYAVESGSRAWGLSPPIVIMMSGIYMHTRKTGI